MSVNFESSVAFGQVSGTEDRERRLVGGVSVVCVDEFSTAHVLFPDPLIMLGSVTYPFYKVLNEASLGSTNSADTPV